MLPFNHDEGDLLEAVSLTDVMRKAKEGKTIEDLTVDELYRLVACKYLVAADVETTFAPLIYKKDIVSKVIEDIENKLRVFIKDMERDEKEVLKTLNEGLDKFIGIAFVFEE